MVASSSSSFSSSGFGWKYDVFINFRGEDTRRGFVSHLYNALAKKPINAFIDAEKFRKGDHLSELLTAIQESRLSIVVFSQNYASSTWCLKELVQILECKGTNNQIVLPIFYEVDPSDVRKLKKSFAEAFAQHDIDSNAEIEEVRSWRSALTTATSLAGWDSRNYDFLVIFGIFVTFREELELSGSKIKELPPSINNLTGLSHLHLDDCKELKCLPSSIRMKSLKVLNLSGCSSLEMFPEISEVIEGLEFLDLSGSKIKELPSSINNLTGLSYLSLDHCEELKCLSSSILVKSLKAVNLSGCSSLEMFPEISEVIEGLEELELSGSKIKELPLSINNLTGLSHLLLDDCKELKCLPSSIRMKSLKTLNLSGCSSLEMFPEISEVIEGLKVLYFSGSKIKELPSSINNLTGLSYLKLDDCKELKGLPSSICQLKSLVYLSLSGCTKFEVFPSIEENMEGLRALFLDGTSIKELSPWIERLTGLQYLNLRNCKSLVHLPDTLSINRTLRRVAAALVELAWSDV
ncbi:hypothetical protein DVH24_024500 [Malus domestica]|uniref:TIR domain-containing protein n=1 Tax=Malus domestica TaxID=3750 RepID=A0A498JIB3_MALDO|nr:hypothetical protein DVH24_024500 [Malus domestica]